MKKQKLNGKDNKMKKETKFWIAIIIFSFIFGYCLIGSVFANQNGFGSVLDNNNGIENQILVNTGDDNGNSDIGEWKNASDIPELKGEKGDTGDQGVKGDIGEQGVQGENGVNGVDGKNGNNGKEGKKGNKGDKGLTGKGLKDRVNLMVGVEHEGEKWIKGVHGGYDVNNQAGIVEIRFTRKIGKSYTNKQIEYLQKQIDEIKVFQNGEELTQFESDNMEIVPTSNGMKIQKKINF